MNGQLATVSARVPNSASPAQLSNHHYLSCILAAQRNGHTCLPEQLGLDTAAYASFQQWYATLPAPITAEDNSALAQAIDERSALRQQLLDLRRDEWHELYTLLLQHRAGTDESESWLAAIVAAACLGSSHLWRDLGLPSRATLRQLLQDNFPVLALRNNRDMRWKKFFYKQLCEQQGGYVCRAPSCDQCYTYQECFGDET